MRNRSCQLQPVPKLPQVTPLLMSKEIKYYWELLRFGSLSHNLVAENWLSVKSLTEWEQRRRDPTLLWLIREESVDN